MTLVGLGSCEIMKIRGYHSPGLGNTFKGKAILQMSKARFQDLTALRSEQNKLCVVNVKRRINKL